MKAVAAYKSKGFVYRMLASYQWSFLQDGLFILNVLQLASVSSREVGLVC